MKISKPKFLLKNPKSDKETLISLIVRFNGERVVYSTGESINPSKWDFKGQRVISSKRNLEANDLNDILDRIENEVKQVFRGLKLNGIIPNPDSVKQELSKRLNDKAPTETKMTLFSYIDKYINATKATRTNSTYKSYKTTYTHLQSYAKFKKITIDFEHIDLSFHSYFTEYLTKELELGQNTIAKYIKVLKVFLNSATEEGFNTNTAYKSKKFSKQTEDVNKIYLNEAEIDKIYNLDLSSDKRLEKVRDLFIIGCSTGLRFSDFISLKSENIEGNLLKIKTQKTGEIVIIPIGAKVNEIYRKYSNNFPSPISNQKMNSYLKEIGQLAEINEVVVVRRMKGGKTIDEIFKKFELISSHCARRSFATNAYLSGLSSISIMKITGHKTEKVFQNYIRFSNEENALKIKDHAFFK